MVKIKQLANASKIKKNRLGLKAKAKKLPRKSIKLEASADTKKAPKKVDESLNDENAGRFVKNSSLTPSSLNINQVKEAITNVIKLDKKAKKDVLFDDEKAVFLQINCIKIPVCPTRQVRFHLKHSFIMDNSEICLITSDLTKGRKIDHDPTVEFYENKLRKEEVKRKITVLPMRQLKTEYDTFELKTKLVKLYDVFLVDAKVSGHIAHILGSNFYRRRKLPTPIRLTIPNLKENIEKALAKTSLSLHSGGNTFTMQVGHTKMTEETIFNNIITVVEQLDKEFPGGFNNVQCLLLKLPKSLAIPFYFSLRNPNDVRVPVVKPTRPKAFQAYTEELSTRYNQEVTILPDGKVFTNRIKKGAVEDLDEESDNEDFQEEENAADDSLIEEKPKKSTKKKQKASATNQKGVGKTALKPEESEDEEEEAKINKAEEEYMQEYEEETQEKLKKEQKKNKGKAVGKSIEKAAADNKRNKKQKRNNKKSATPNLKTKADQTANKKRKPSQETKGNKKKIRKST